MVEASHFSTAAYRNYPNLNMSAVWQDAYYGANYDRLRAVKSAYDPGSVFSTYLFAVEGANGG